MYHFLSKIGRCLVSQGGVGAELKGITELASRYFDTRISLSSPFDKISAPAFIGDVLKTAGPSFAASVGLALRALQN
jgi:Tfp pilus assembly PilM family ATPase